MNDGDTSKINMLSGVGAVINMFLCKLFSLDSEEVFENFIHKYNFVIVINQMF